MTGSESPKTIECLKTDVIERFGTPCAVVDLDVVDRNIAHVQTLCDAAGLANRRITRLINLHFWRDGSLMQVPSESPARNSVRPR
ncbi:MAG: hypothetical protein VXB94_10620 [Rhodobiaceae bacterium]